MYVDVGSFYKDCNYHKILYIKVLNAIGLV